MERQLMKHIGTSHLCTGSLGLKTRRQIRFFYEARRRPRPDWGFEMPSSLFDLHKTHGETKKYVARAARTRKDEERGSGVRVRRRSGTVIEIESPTGIGIDDETELEIESRTGPQAKAGLITKEPVKCESDSRTEGSVQTCV
ncbi:hypothetical protein EVAR_50343_1 [Eumeta japonica]|uniref:Uncharacterized protein n=1 Tax=Eumeta variegata TaxID=151549 RepID=A0A4C1XLP1_EUMVA|nr:hypothetical protein EVAR_50343_1 [Eumeta japonica]